MSSRIKINARVLFACVVLGSLPLRALAVDNAAAVAHFKADIQPILTQLCMDCHGNGLNKGKIAFDKLDTDAALLNHELWWKVLKNVRAGIMPPSEEPRPNAEQLKKLETWIKQDVFGIDPKDPDPGRVTIRRLNRVEYRNTIRDLMGIDFRADEEFPPDDTGYGFDNIADVLSISPMLLEKYMQAAETIAAKAVPIVNKVVQEQSFTGAQFMRGGGGRGGGQGLNFNTARTVSQKLKVDQAGEYRVSVEFTINGSFDFDPGQARIAFKVDNEELFHDTYRWQGGKKYEYSKVLKWEPGERELAFDLQPLARPDTQPSEEPAPQAQGGRGAAPRTSIDMRITSVRVNGPLEESLWKAPPNYARFFPRESVPTAAAERKEYAREVLNNFTARAFRRPVDSRTVDRLVAIAESVYTQPGKVFEQGIAHAMIAVLASPRFIFRVEQPLPNEAQQRWGMIDEYALASRLSYFLWSTMPDKQLLDLAQAGELRKNLDAQVKRMLADEKSAALIENFTGQWLEARDVEGIAIDERVVLARDAGTEAQLRREEEERAAAQAARRGGRGNRGQQAAPQGQQQQPAAGQPAAQAQPAAPADAQPQANPAPANAQPQTDAAALAQAQANAQPGQPAVPANQQQARGRRGGRGNLGARPPPAVELTRDLRRSMREETQMYFGYIVREDRSILELIDSNYTFVNEALAKHYGIPDVSGTDMRRVELPADSPRGGVLTQASVLIVTSNSTRTSPVKRGLFVLDNILGTPAPPAPNDIPALEDSEKKFGDREPTVREAMQMHREMALCAACHLRMDALGLALENFNALGMWRTKERNQDIDTSGQLISGEKLAGLKDLKNVLKNERKLDFYRCLTEKVMTYALGRGLEYYDTETVDRIVDRLSQNDGRFSALLMGVIESSPFQERRNVTVPVAQAANQ